MATNHLPNQQKAIIFNTTTETLSFTNSAPLPQAPKEHLIKVHSTAITNKELTWGPFVHWPDLHIPCYDVSGTILSTVQGSPFKVGDKVFGRVEAGREGTAREYATIFPSEAALIPKGLSMLDAASVPMSAHTAWQAIFEQGLLTGSFAASSVPAINDAGELEGKELAKGKRVLVLGAAGGVGLFAVQFSKLAGAYVAGTASAKNTEFLESLGIDGVIDYTEMSVESYVSGDESNKFDLVFDCVGSKSMLDGWHGVKSNGVYVSVVAGFSEPEGGKPAGVRIAWFIMKARGEELERIGKFFTKGLLRTWVDSVWKLEDYESAFAKAGSGHARGKVVMKLAEEE